MENNLVMSACCKCGRVTHVRRVTDNYEYLCDPCSCLVLAMSIRDFMHSLPSWHKNPSSPSQLRQSVEKRRRLLLREQGEQT